MLSISKNSLSNQRCTTGHFLGTPPTSYWERPKSLWTISHFGKASQKEYKWKLFIQGTPGAHVTRIKPAVSSPVDDPVYFHGFHIPKEPKVPEADGKNTSPFSFFYFWTRRNLSSECCMSGARSVYTTCIRTQWTRITNPLNLSESLSQTCKSLNANGR